jgi:chromosome segregation ATPase
MPEVGGGAFEVSQEEERYLRRVFLRFAGPYLGALAALVLLALALIAGLAQRDADAGPSAAAAREASESAAHSELLALQEQLRTSAARLATLEHAQEKAADQLGALERRVRSAATPVDTASVSELRDALASASERIEALERRAGSASGAGGALEPEVLGALQRLEARLARVERVAAATPAPASPER